MVTGCDLFSKFIYQSDKIMLIFFIVFIVFSSFFIKRQIESRSIVYVNVM
jgi:hypothetical protein